MKNKKLFNAIYYAFWVILCLTIIGFSTYPFISDFMLAQKQEKQVEAFDKKDSKISKQDFSKKKS